MEEKLKNPLLALRLSVFLVMLIWTVDKFLNPAHGVQIFEHFYMISGLSHPIMMAIGVVELIIIVGFLLGLKKRWTYGLVLVMHAVSTLASFKLYLSPWASPNMLFWAAWPMLAACYALYVLRDHDTKWTVSAKK